ncbi:MAG: ABC transporter ATP-binding protein [Eubacterium sp.]|nr:ABC transporter ATP-binding protein [Eubacterium sp.]
MKIDLEDVSFGYKKHPVFEHIRFSFDSLQFVCLIGPNGAGKSTLLKCINGIHSPTGGRVLADGEDVQKMHLLKRAEIFGYVPQFTVANPSLNVLETVISGRMPRMQGRASAADVEAAEEILTEMDLEDFALRSMNQLSGGERQRVLIARALAQEPQVMLLDEPTSNLDMHYQLETMELLEKTVREKQIGVIAVIHDLNAVLRFADLVLLLNKGGLYASGRPEDVITENTLAHSFEIISTFTQAAEIPVMVPLASNKTRRTEQ